LVGYLGGDPLGVAAASVTIVAWLLVSLALTHLLGVALIPAQAVGLLAGAGLSFPIWRRWRRFQRKYRRMPGR